MPAYNFKTGFADPVEVGAKRQTIRRRRRKRPTRAGDVLYLYKGMRTKACESIGDHWCYAVDPIAIRADGLWLDRILQTPEQADAIARADGFAGLEDLIEFMVGLYGPLPLEDLQLIKWEHLVVVNETALAIGILRKKSLADRHSPRDAIDAIQPGHIGRIVSYTVTGNAWNDIAIGVEFYGYQERRTVRPAHIRSVYAPDHIWPGRTFERVTTCH